MTTVRQDQALSRDLLYPLATAVIGDTKIFLEGALKGFDFQFLIDTICDEFAPDEIFSEETLSEWALANGFTKVTP
jgi:hypothetical protein